MNRNSILFWGILLLCVSNVFGQRPVNGNMLDLNPFKERNIAIKKALLPGIYLIQEKYVVVDKEGNEFGSAGQDFFSTRYYIGAATANGILLPVNATQPEVGDSLFDTYKADYTASINHVAYRPVDDTSSFTEVDMEKELNMQAPAITKVEASVFTTHTYKQVKEAKLLLFVIDDGKDPATTAPRVSVITLDEFEWDANGKADIKDITIRNTTVLGGVLFYEEVDFASISYQMIGFYEQENGNWYVQAVDAVTAAPTNELSPIGNKKKKK